MTGGAGPDWDPGAYGRYAELRLRPARDLLARVPAALPEGALVDLGCGAGAAGPALAARWPDRRLTGIDNSPAMLEAARATGRYDALDLADAARWRPAEPPALVFANAALQWLADHAALMPRLAGVLAPGGVLAVQMPRQWGAPSHRLLRACAVPDFMAAPPRAAARDPVADAQSYARLLAPFGEVDAWETLYVQRLAGGGRGHPVRHFTAATAMRPFTAALAPVRAAAFVAAYDEALAKAYPPEEDGSVLFEFRRVFFVLRRPA